jgi:hypothetical protein
MGSFFSVNEDAHVVVSHQFWLYWAIVLPLTGIVILTWLSWLRLDKILARREEYEEFGAGVGKGSRQSLLAT